MIAYEGLVAKCTDSKFRLLGYYYLLWCGYCV